MYKKSHNSEPHVSKQKLKTLRFHIHERNLKSDIIALKLPYKFHERD